MTSLMDSLNLIFTFNEAKTSINRNKFALKIPFSFNWTFWNAEYEKKKPGMELLKCHYD